MSFVDAAATAATAALAWYGAKHTGSMVGNINIDAIELARLAELQQRLLGGKGVKALPTTDKPISRIPPPWIEAPAGRVPIDFFGTVAMPVVGAQAVVLTFPVPEGYDGVVSDYALNYTGAGFVNGSGDLVWQILANGRPIRNFSNITAQKGSEQFPRKISSGIPIASGQIITVVIQHVANVALGAAVTASLLGYLYPRQGQQ